MPVEEIRTLTEGLMQDVTDDLAALVRIPSCAFPGFPPEPVLQTAQAVVDLLQRYGIHPLDSSKCLAVIHLSSPKFPRPPVHRHS